MSRDSIKNRILIPFLAIILSSLLLSLILFNLIIGAYFKTAAKNELVNTMVATERVVNLEFQSPNTYDPYGIAAPKLINRLNFLLQSFSNLNETKFLLISNNFDLLFPSSIESGSDINYINKNILPVLKSQTDKLKSKKIFTFNANSTKYLAAAYQFIFVSSSGASDSGYIIYYTNMSKSENILNAANIILIFILLMAAVMAFITSLVVSERITKPIKALCSYAKTIGDRNFKTYSFEKFGGEIEELAHSMNNMAIKLNEYDKAQQTFLQNASHELRTPLMSIQGYAEGLKYGVFEDVQKASNTIIDESKRLTSLVEELLYLSRLDALSDSYEPEKIDLSHFLKECISRLEGLVLKENIQLVYDTPHQTVFVMADCDKLSRAIINIISNCIRYASNKVTIELSHKNANTELLIKDDGKGFDEEDLNNLFTRFYKGQGGDFGLGLSISKTIINQHSGEIAAGNCETGAQFVITIPLSK